MHLPIINTPEEAFALALQHHDKFYFAAFKLQFWIDQLALQAIAHYAEMPDPADRPMQDGQAWRSFQRLFPSVPDDEFHQVIDSLARYSEGQNPVSIALLKASAPLEVEHDISGDFLGPKAPDLSHRPRELALLRRRTVQRLCDWLDALMHLDTHILWFREPSCFDPDPERRRLVCLELSQQYVAQMDEPGLLDPYLPQSPTARLSQPAGPSPTSGAAAPPTKRPWPFSLLDEAIIALWPLLKLHNWTYADLWNVLRDAGMELAASPCPDHRRLAAYCFHSLGLRKTARGHTSRQSKPPGHAVALRLLLPQPRSPLPCEAPWS